MSFQIFICIMWCSNVARFLKIVLSSRIGILSQNNRRTRIPRWLGQENEENVARTRNCCGCSSSPRLALILGFISQWMMRWIKRCNRCCNFNLFWIATCLNLDPTLPTLKLKQGRNCLCIIKPWVLYPVLLSFEPMSENHDVNLCRRIMMWTYVGEPWCEPMSENYHVNLCRRTMMWTYVGEPWCEHMSENYDVNLCRRTMMGIINI